LPRSATELVPAPRAEVWAILAEPLHLADWWPGIALVEPDRRGFAPGARWRARAARRNPFFSRHAVDTTILVRDVENYERWSWHLVSEKLTVEVRLRASGDHETEVTVTTSRGAASVPQDAVGRLRELVRTLA
jgi:uncharacterized protein YndB with AHSA1/START domain